MKKKEEAEKQAQAKHSKSIILNLTKSIIKHKKTKQFIL